MPEKLIFLLGVVVLVGAGLYLFPTSAASQVRQPIAYSHRVHLAKNITCPVCHQGVQTAAQATLPAAQTCNTCHQAPVTKNPEAEKIKQYLAVDAIPWVRMFKLRDDVLFPHNVHVQQQKIACQTCHGDMTKVDTAEKGFGRNGGGGPYGLELMNGLCLDCHRRPAPSPQPTNGGPARPTLGPTDCIACHK